MQPRIHRIGAAVAIALGAAVLTPVALAQQPPLQQPQTPAQQAPAQQPAQQQAPTQQAAPTPPSTGPAPTEAELQNFAGAAKDVENIRQQVQPQIDTAKTPDARAKLQRTAEQKMEAAVRDHHLSVQRYQQIAMAAQTDAAVRAKVIKLLGPPPAAS